MKCKVLLISPIPPPIGGIASWSNILLNYNLKYQSDFLISHQNTAIKYRDITDVNIFKRLVGGIRDTLNIIKELKKNIFRVNPDLIHLTSSASFALIKDVLLIKIAIKNKIPIIIHFHFGRIPELAKKKNWEWFLLCRAIKHCNKVIVIDEKSFNTLIDYGFNNIINIPNPISMELEEIARKKLPTVLRNKNKVVFVGHIVVAKGVFELVKACSSIPEIRELILIGPYETTIKNELDSLSKRKKDKKWLKFTGTLDKNEIYNYLENASLLALPSYTEGFPNVVLESMALGCPVVATNVGAIPEMLDIYSDTPSGICVNSKSVEQLSIAISTLIAEPLKAKIIGDNGHEKVLANYTISNISSLYEKVWVDFIEK